MSAGGHERANVNRRATAIEKANVYTMKNDSTSRAMTNRAIIQELDNNMRLTAQKIKLASRTEYAEATQTDGPLVECDRYVDNQITGVVPLPQMGPLPSSKIPVLAKTVTKQKSDKMKVTRRQRNVVQDYKPGYTWNRGGRVKELRIRCIARKYYQLWKNKVFGRILPSTARQHYQRRLLKKTFAVWSEMWWEVRKEWALTVRADLHNRYRISNRVWHAWREYTLMARVKTIQKKIADHHAKTHICSRVIQAWQIYVEMRHTKKALYAKADEVYRANVKRQFWQKWQHQYEMAASRKHQEMAALQHWADHVTYKAWYIWKKKYVELQFREHQYQLAVANHSKALMRRSFHAWLKYIEMRRLKHRDYDQAVTWHKQRQLKQCLSIWHDRFCLARQLAEHRVYMDLLARRALCRRVFIHWKFYVHLRKQGYEKKAIAAAHYRTQLLKSALAAWRFYISQNRIKLLRQQLAMEHHCSTLLKRSWLRWLERCEEREDMLVVVESRKARQHYSITLMVKAWQAWRQYIYWRRHRKEQYMRADVFYITQALPKYLTRWQQFVEFSRRKREMVEAAASFRRENLLAQFFYKWHSEYEQSQDERLAERMAILHHEELIKKQMFALWWSKTQQAVEENFKMTLAAEHYSRRLCKTVLQNWKGIISEKKKMIRNTHQAVRHWYIHLMHKVLLGWRTYLSERRHKKTLKLRADSHLKRKLLRLTFTRWQHYHGWWGEINAYVETKLKEKNQQLLRHTINVWLSNARELRLESEKWKIATAQYNVTLLQKVIVSWHQFVIMRIYKKQKTEELVRGAQTVLNKGKLKRSLQRWQTMTQLAISERENNEKALSHYHKRLIVRAWRAWHEAVRLSIRKQLLMRQAMWLHNQHLAVQFFNQWKSAYSEALDIKNKSNLALWHWSISLQHKVFHAWLLYTSGRRRKAQRIADALQARRSRLLRDGVTQWLRLAAGMAEIRQKYAVQRGAQNYYHLHQVVLRCASHWRHLTARKKQERGKSDGRQSAEKKQFGVLPKTLQPSVPVVIPEPCASPARDALGGLMVARRQRAAPRKPDFLLDSLKREGLYQSEDKSLFTQGEDVQNTNSGMIFDNEVVLPSSDRHILCLPAKGMTSEETRFVNFETSTSLGAQSKSCDTQTSDNINVSSISHLNTSDRNRPVSDVSVLSKHRCRKPVVEGQISVTSEADTDLEPRHPPQPSVENSNEIGFERSDELNISTSIITECQSDVADQSSPIGSRMMSEKLAQQPSAAVFHSSSDVPGVSQNGVDGAAAVALLPPMAFMFHKDGTPIQNCEDHEPGSGMSSAPESTASLAPRNAGLPENKTDRDRLVLMSPADELFLIRKRLKQFQECRKQLKQSRCVRNQLKSWMEEQLSKNVQMENDTDLGQVQEEISILEEEIRMLSEQIEKEKPNIRRLTDRVEQLLSVVTMAT